MTENKIPGRSDTPAAFMGLQSYSEAQAKDFFGRDEEIASVTALVKSNPLTLVFGKSGTGKTSLLNAGVFPRLRKNYCLPFRIRLDFKEDSPDLMAQVKNVLKSEIDKYGFKVQQYPGPETLWEYFHREPLWRSITPILVLDQFEEIFTLGKEIARFAGREIADFWTELSNLIENRIPESLHDLYLNHREEVTYNYKRQPVKVLFAFREEYLPNFETIPSAIPSLKYSRFRLMPMNKDQAFEVITRTWGNRIDPPQANQIISYLSRDEVISSLTVIEPALLSQICTYLEKARLEGQSDKISADLLAKFPKETILRSIYDEEMDRANRAALEASGPHAGGASHVDDPRPLNTFAEENLITTGGYRIEYALKDSDQVLDAGIQLLLATYFLREETNQADHSRTVELTHDVLVPLIKEDREKRRSEIARMAARQKAKKRALKIVWYTLLGVGLMVLASLKYESRIVQEIVSKSDTLNRIQRIYEDSTRSLNDFRHRIKSERQQYYDSIARGSGSAGMLLPGPDSVFQDLTLLETEVNQLRKDSARFNQNNSSLQTLAAQLKANLYLLSTQKDSLQQNMNRLSSAHWQLSQDFSLLQRRYQALQRKLLDRDREYDSLVEQYLYLVKAFPDAIPAASPCEVNGTDSSMVNLVLEYEIPKEDKNGRKVLIPSNFTIYLIPDIAANKKIIRSASVYEIRANEPMLKKARGYQIARYCGGRYIFSHVPKGKYLIKVCTYYGGYLIYDKKASGIDTVHMEISPPIR